MSKKKPHTYSLRRATKPGTCPRCGKPYERGEMLAGDPGPLGERGVWFHETHLGLAERRKAWTARVGRLADRPLRGGGWETNRRRH